MIVKIQLNKLRKKRVERSGLKCLWNFKKNPKHFSGDLSNSNKKSKTIIQQFSFRCALHHAVSGVFLFVLQYKTRRNTKEAFNVIFLLKD